MHIDLLCHPFLAQEIFIQTRERGVHISSLVSSAAHLPDEGGDDQLLFAPLVSALKLKNLSSGMKLIFIVILLGPKKFSIQMRRGGSHHIISFHCAHLTDEGGDDQHSFLPHAAREVFADESVFVRFGRLRKNNFDVLDAFPENNLDVLLKFRENNLGKCDYMLHLVEVDQGGGECLVVVVRIRVCVLGRIRYYLLLYFCNNVPTPPQSKTGPHQAQQRVIITNLKNDSALKVSRKMKNAAKLRKVEDTGHHVGPHSDVEIEDALKSKGGWGMANLNTKKTSRDTTSRAYGQELTVWWAQLLAESSKSGIVAVVMTREADDSDIVERARELSCLKERKLRRRKQGTYLAALKT
ncbi:hypothetical protein Tco_0484216 [Tanacetum coccineum]